MGKGYAKAALHPSKREVAAPKFLENRAMSQKVKAHAWGYLVGVVVGLGPGFSALLHFIVKPVVLLCISLY